MATTNILVDLALSQKWLSRDNASGAIKGYFEQKQDNYPLVAWSLNTIPFSNGIKSLCPQASPWVADFPVSVNYSNMWEITSILGADGNLTYLVMDDSLTYGQRKFYYWYEGDWIYLTGNTIGHFNYFHSKTTVFQNQTVCVLPGGAEFGPEITVDGDAITENSIFLFDITTATASVYNLTAIEIRLLQGIGSFNNYLLFWDASRLYWSSPIDFVDFTPSIGGGGSTQISEAKGDIIAIVPNPSGLMIYCKLNVVHAAFSGDSSNPWIFTEVPNSSGILIEDGNPVVTTNEVSEFQIYMSAQGLQVVTANGAEALDKSISEYINASITELKDVGTSEITLKKINYVTYAASKVRKLILLGKMLFIFAGESALTVSELSNNRLFTVDLGTGQIGKHEGDYHSVYYNLNLAKDIDAGVDLYNKVDAFPSQFITGKRITGLQLRTPVVLDYAGGIERELVPFTDTLQYREAEIFVGVISLSRSKSTAVHTVKPIGQVMRDGDIATLARVFVYSASTAGASNPAEFVYNPVDEKYYGFAEGKDLMVEVRGDYFYLTALDIEVEQGGEW